MIRFAKALQSKERQREETTMRRIALASTTLLALCTGTQAADQVKLGNLTQLSGPISPAGTETKRGIDLALEELGNKLGGLPVKYTVVDAGIFAVGALAGPLQFAGKECHPNGFFVSFSNDDWPAAVGKYMTDKGVKSAFFLGADYQAGYEHVGAAIKYFKGKAIGPVYTPLSQLDFAPEIARIRAEKPDAVFAFLVGAGGVAFVKQYAQAGLQHQLPFYTEDPVANPLTFPAQGDAALGVIMGTNWTADLDNAANKKFVASFTAKYNRLPATFAALGYDAIKLIDSAVAEVGGKIENKDAVRAALRKANFQSVRGAFKFNNNHFPIQNLYIMEVKKDENGNLKAALKDTAIKDWQDPYHQECPMKW